MKSKFFKLNLRDLIKGLVVAFVTAILTGLFNLIQSGGIISLKAVLIPAVLALISYLIKNLFTNSEDSLLTGEK